MIRKVLSMLLALALVLTMPLCASASNQHTLTIIPGDDLASIEVAKDLLDALSFTLVPGEKSGALTLSLNGNDIATVGVGADTTGLYAQSNLLSDSVLYVTWDDGFALLESLVEMATDSEGNELGAEEKQAMIAAMEEAKVAIQSGSMSAAALEPTVSTSVEDAKKQIAEMFGNDPKMVEYVDTLIQKMTVETGLFTAEGRDPADQKTSLTLNGEDIALVCETAYMRNFMEQMVSGMDDGDEINVDELLAQVRDIYVNSNLVMSFDAYTADGDENLVGMDLSMSMVVKTEDYESPVSMVGRYDRLSTETGVSHKGDLSMKLEDVEALMKVDVLKGADGVTEGYAGMLADGEELVVTYTGKPVAEKTRERFVSLYLREGAAAVVAPSASDRPLISFRLVSAPDAQNRLAELEQSTPENSVNVFSLSEEEMQSLMNDAMSRSMQAFYKALSELPASVMNQIFGQAE